MKEQRRGRNSGEGNRGGSSIVGRDIHHRSRKRF
jgi:hypothetical protein